MSYVMGFAPWIIWAILSGSNWRAGLFAAAVAALLLAVRARQAKDLDVLTGVTLLFFAVMAVIALVDPRSGLHNWATALSAGTLIVAQILGFAIPMGFTVQYSNRAKAKGEELAHQAEAEPAAGSASPDRDRCPDFVGHRSQFRHQDRVLRPPGE